MTCTLSRPPVIKQRRAAGMLAIGFMLCWWGMGCASVAAFVPKPVAAEAQQAFAHARRLREGGASANDPKLWRALERATELAPSWLAPARFGDNLLAEEVRLVEALERRRFQLQQSPGDAGLRYLVARLEQGRDPAVYQRIANSDPRLAWAQHAFAVTHASHGPRAITVEAWLRAMELARASWDKAYFAVRLAEFLSSQELETEAREHLELLLVGGTLKSDDRAWLGAVLAGIELNSEQRDTARRGYARGLRLLGAGLLPLRIFERLAGRLMLATALDDPGAHRLEAVLLENKSAAGRLSLGRLWMRLGHVENVRALARHTGEEALLELLGEVPSVAQLFEDGEYEAGMDLWLTQLPAQVIAEDGLPLDNSLRGLVLVARTPQENVATPEALVRLTEALLQTGWYATANLIAGRILEFDFEQGQRLLARAARGVGLFGNLESLLQDVEQSSQDLQVAAGYPGDVAADLGTVDDLLRRFGAAFARADGDPMGKPEDRAYRDFFASSPMVHFGPAATLVHPGPWFSAADEAAGRGKQGAKVPGLAELMARHGRFAVLGEALGAGPDGVVLRRILVEHRQGEHLGVAWQGTIAWCDGVDVASRAQRLGAGVSGAAVHEGYWVDLAQVRKGYSNWQRATDAFRAPSQDTRATERLESALATRGLKLRTAPSNPRARQRERTASVPSLGSATRVKLALLRERAQPGQLLGELSLTEFVELVATHEEGHLCDQTRFLPWQKNLTKLVAFALDQAFSPSAIRERLEYRAELVALCAVSDPRLVLIQLLGAAESDGDLYGLGHGPAYRDLLDDFLQELDAARKRAPADWPELSAEHVLIQQLHRLGPEKVRAIGLKLAAKEGLVG